MFLQSGSDCAGWVENSANVVVFTDAPDQKFTSWFGMARPQHYVIDKAGKFTYMDPDTARGDCGQCGSWDDAVYTAQIKAALPAVESPTNTKAPSESPGNTGAPSESPGNTGAPPLQAAVSRSLGIRSLVLTFFLSALAAVLSSSGMLGL